MNIIHTHNTPDFSDDTVDIYTDLIRWDPWLSWKDQQGNLYLGFPHTSGVMVFHPDGTSIAYMGSGVWDTSGGWSKRTLVRKMPRLGARVARTATTHPFFRDPDGNLWVGTNEGLTVLHYNRGLGRYDTSKTYRKDGLYDTTEDPDGILIDSGPKLPHNYIYDAWRDENGDVYISTKGSLSVLHPDDIITTYNSASLPGLSASWVMHSSKDDKGNVYISAAAGPEESKAGARSGLFILHPDGRVTHYSSVSTPALARDFVRGSWVDAKGNI